MIVTTTVNQTDSRPVCLRSDSEHSPSGRRLTLAIHSGMYSKGVGASPDSLPHRQPQRQRSNCPSNGILMKLQCSVIAGCKAEGMALRFETKKPGIQWAGVTIDLMGAATGGGTSSSYSGKAKVVVFNEAGKHRVLETVDSEGVADDRRVAIQRTTTYSAPRRGARNTTFQLRSLRGDQERRVSAHPKIHGSPSEERNQLGSRP